MTTTKEQTEDNGINQIELDAVMYEIPVLMEEIKLSREHLMLYVHSLPSEDVYRFSRTSQRIVQHLGHLAYAQKQEGKRLDMNFSFKLDLYDEIFDTPTRNVPESELPEYEELMAYLDDIHETFMGEFRYRKKAEALYNCINRDYAASCAIRDMMLEFGYEDPAPSPRSQRVTIRPDSAFIHGPEYFLPVCAN